MERTLYVHVSLKFGCSFLFRHSCERCSGMEETVIPIFVLPYFFWIRATSRFIDMYSRLSIICFSMFFIHFVRVNANIRRYSSHSPVFSFAPIFNLSRWACCFNRYLWSISVFHFIKIFHCCCCYFVHCTDDILWKISYFNICISLFCLYLMLADLPETARCMQSLC